MEDVLFTKLLSFITSGQLYPGEELKEINNTNGKYFISSYGRVLSICGKPTLLKPYLRNGYESIRINNKHYYIHRLVVEYFISRCIIEKVGFLEVHHKDKNKLNNNVNNLQILTKKQHIKLHRKREVIEDED